MRTVASRPLGLALVAALLVGAVACGGSDQNASSDTNPADNGVVAEPLVYQNQAYCVYPDDLDDLSEDAVAAYCADVIDPDTALPVDKQYWLEAEEPGHFDVADTTLANAAWTYYLTYVTFWFLSDMFVKAYLPSNLHGNYRTKHQGYATKYASDIAAHSSKGRYLTRDGRPVPPNQLHNYRIAPRSCKLIAYTGGGAVVPVELAATPRRRTTKNTVPTGKPTVQSTSKVTKGATTPKSSGGPAGTRRPANPAPPTRTC